MLEFLPDRPSQLGIGRARHQASKRPWGHVIGGYVDIVVHQGPTALRVDQGGARRPECVADAARKRACDIGTAATIG